MDSLIAASARALAAGDALGALKRVALRDDPPALALRGIAMAQLGEHPRARELLRRAARGFGAHEELARARCVVAEAEVALAMRDLGGSPRSLAAAAATLEAHADRANALQARLIAARRLLAARPPRRGRGRAGTARCARPAAVAGGGGRAGRGRAGAALAAHRRRRGRRSPVRTRRPIAHACRRCWPRWRRRGPRSIVPPPGASSPAASRRCASTRSQRCWPRARWWSTPAVAGLRAGAAWRPLARRPVLFALARALAEAWPGDVDREALIARAFRTRRPDETHRARLRVEIGRLRALVTALAQHRGHRARLRPQAARRARRRRAGAADRRRPGVAGGAALRRRGLVDLGAGAGPGGQPAHRPARARRARGRGRVRSIGRARARRWLAPPLAGFTTILLLPAALPIE